MLPFSCINRRPTLSGSGLEELLDPTNCFSYCLMVYSSLVTTPQSSSRYFCVGKWTLTASVLARCRRQLLVGSRTVCQAYNGPVEQKCISTVCSAGWQDPERLDTNTGWLPRYLRSGASSNFNNKQILLTYYIWLYPAGTRRQNDVVTLYRRCFNVSTSHQRPYNVILTSCAGWVVTTMTLFLFSLKVKQAYFVMFSCFIRLRTLSFGEGQVGRLP